MEDVAKWALMYHAFGSGYSIGAILAPGAPQALWAGLGLGAATVLYPSINEMADWIADKSEGVVTTSYGFL